MNEQNVSRLFEGLSPEQKKQVMSILSDKKQTERILGTPEAQKLMKKLSGGSKGG